MTPQAQNRRAFTLLELIVAMMVIGLLIGISIPAITALTSGSGMNTAARKVTNLMELARSQAIAKNTVTRFGIALEWPDDESQTFKKCAIWEWDRKTEEFRQIQNWETLPSSVYFETESEVGYIKDSQYAEKNRSTVVGTHLLGEDAERSEFDVDFNNQTIPVRFIEFKASGRARLRGSEQRRVYTVLVNGARQNSSFTYIEQKDGSPSNWAQINVDTLTGRTRILRP